MSSTSARVDDSASGAFDETPVTRNLVLKKGKYVIKNVPHLHVPDLTPMGDPFIREAHVDLNLSRIYKYMQEHKLSCVDYKNPPKEIDFL